MKTFNKIIAIALSWVIAFSACFRVFASKTENEPVLNSISEYEEYLMNEGYPVFTTANFIGMFNTVNTVFRVLTGTWIFPEKRFNVVVDGYLTDVSEHIATNSGLDFVAILGNIPETNQPADIITTVFQIDTAEMRKQMHGKSDEYFAEGNSVLGFVYGFISIYMSVITKCEIYALPSEDNPDLYEVYIRLTYKDGGTEEFYPGLIINSVTGECYNHNDMGIVGTGFNMNLSEMLVYATVNCWMRNYGFCFLYDVVARTMPVFFNYKTRRFKFEYNGLEYMIQIWKGNYTISNGGEVGVYCRDKSEFGSYYDSASDDRMLDMSMQILHGDEILVDKPLQKHWWINGFHLGTRMYLPESLTMKFSVVMTDEEMLNAFCEAIDNHFMQDVTYTVDGLTINAVW
ncbi:MAG: DUF4474 domain-containing protein [Clostridia bacterium]|nr:DUF4474 domain-containing protein [Clostridia bacterium]